MPKSFHPILSFHMAATENQYAIRQNLNACTIQISMHQLFTLIMKTEFHVHPNISISFLAIIRSYHHRFNVCEWTFLERPLFEVKGANLQLKTTSTLVHFHRAVVTRQSIHPFLPPQSSLELHHHWCHSL